VRAALDESALRFFDRDAYRLLMSALRTGRVAVIDARNGKALDNPLLQRQLAQA